MRVRSQGSELRVGCLSSRQKEVAKTTIFGDFSRSSRRENRSNSRASPSTPFSFPYEIPRAPPLDQNKDFSKARREWKSPSLACYVHFRWGNAEFSSNAERSLWKIKNFWVIATLKLSLKGLFATISNSNKTESRSFS